mgnify:CR=1 FL=1
MDNERKCCCLKGESSLEEWYNIAYEFVDSHRGGIVTFSYGILAVGILQNIVYLAQIPLAAIELMRTKLRTNDEHTSWLVSSEITLPISIVIPAYNEEVTIVDTAIATLATQYPSFEVIIVNDGSKDDTLDLLIKRFNLSKTERFYENKLEHKKIIAIYTSPVYSNLVVIDKENGGRSDALNTGIDVCRTPLFCTLDADSLLDPSALLKTIQPFIDKPEIVVATGGTIRVLNGCEVEAGMVTKLELSTNLLALFQILEYNRAFLIGRLAWSCAGILTLISGAFSVFKRELAVDVGGFSTTTIGEDFELVLKMHKHCRYHKIK